ncbi:MAG: nucleoside-diphosphate kinase, partial [Patescibacteria group bacterium]
MQSTPVLAMCWEGLDVVETVRKITGITKAREAESGSIRGDFAMSVACNVIHASDTVENAGKEVKRFFKADELYDYDKSEYVHVYAEDERK